VRPGSEEAQLPDLQRLGLYAGCPKEIKFAYPGVGCLLLAYEAGYADFKIGVILRQAGD